MLPWENFHDRIVIGGSFTSTENGAESGAGKCGSTVSGKEISMKKTWTALVIFLVMVCGIAAFGQQPGETPLFAVKATMQTEGETIFKTGVIIPLKLVLNCPETHQAGSWRAVAYLRDIPKDFEKRPGFSV